MPYNKDTGYVPHTFDEWMSLFREKINERYKPEPRYTPETFIGTNYYDILYPICQALVEGDSQFADVWVKLTEYFDQVNARINDPKVVNDGIVHTFEQAGLIAAVRPMTADTAGKIAVCVFADTGDQETQAKIVRAMTGSVAGGIVSDGDKTADDTLNNGQLQTWNWFEPTDVNVDIRMTIYYVNNNGKSLPSADEVTQDLRDKINQRYRYGTPFSPTLMYQQATDAPFATQLKIEWSDDGETWSTDIRKTKFNEKMIFNNISVNYSAV